MNEPLWGRRDFIRLSSLGLAQPTTFLSPNEGNAGLVPQCGTDTGSLRSQNGIYQGRHLDRIAFPMGGIGAGMICLGGTGALTQFSLQNRPDLTNEPLVFSAISVKFNGNNIARILEGPVPSWKLYPGGEGATGLSPSGGLPRFKIASFRAQYPFANVTLVDDDVPVRVNVTGWSPFEPGDADNSSLPVVGLEYVFTNRSEKDCDVIFSFNLANFLASLGLGGLFVRARLSSTIEPTPGGVIFHSAKDPDKPWETGSFAAWIDDPAVKVNHAWYRGGWIDPMAMAWRDIQCGACYERPPQNDGSTPRGASIFSPFTLSPGNRKTIKLRLAWYFPQSNLRSNGLDIEPTNNNKETYRPWYAGRFPHIRDVITYWQSNYGHLKQRAELFSRCFHDSTLPPEVIEAVAANLATLKSPTVLRQTDGRLWGWEGSAQSEGAFPGSCTHVWNYAQAVPHLFPSLERNLRETEFLSSQNSEGHQVFRAALPIRPIEDPRNRVIAATDGQLGGIMKTHRDWRISGDSNWLRALWPQVRKSLDYCIRTWDPKHKGWLEEPQFTTYDHSFWGPNGMCTSIYLGALKAAVAMGRALKDDVSPYEALFDKGAAKLETELFNGEYFFQKIEWRDLNAHYPADDALSRLPDKGMEVSLDTPEVQALTEKEGPPNQYGNGCLSDGVFGAWLAWVCGLGNVAESGKVRSHLRAVHRYNFKKTLFGNGNVFRSSFACGDEGGLLLCTWPKGSALSLPMTYSAEVWTGIEYQVASHMITLGMVEEGLEIVRTTRTRYDGRIRNPFDDIEAGHWYARAMSSYALLQAFSGARFDAVDKILHLAPPVEGDFRCFISTATGYGTVGIRNGKPFLEVASGEIPYKRIEYTAPQEVRDREESKYTTSPVAR